MRLLGLLRFICCSLLPTAVYGSHPNLGRECGITEKGEAGIRYYMDDERKIPYPYYYKGCGATGPLYKTPEAVGIVVDFVTCPGWVDSVGICKLAGKGISHPGYTAVPDKCPLGAECTLFPMAEADGCCSIAVKLRFEKNQKAAKCGPGREAQRNAKGGIFFGRNCSHNFCQNGATCVDEEFESYCCVQIKEDDLMGRECRPGEKTKATPGIKYYYDHGRDTAYPFYYKGCGGKEYFFDNLDDKPYIPDYQACLGWYFGGLCAVPGGHPDHVNDKCKPGDYCVREHFGYFGSCCSPQVDERFKKSRTPQCASGRQPLRYPNGDIVFGRNCSHNFCQNGAKCVEGEFDAHCCVAETVVEVEDALLGRECRPGEKAKATPGIKYFVEKDRCKYYPFYYKGCGGTTKFYNTSNSWLNRDMEIMECQTCPGFKTFGGCVGKYSTMPSNNCSKGHYCLERPLSGHDVCCSLEVQARYFAELIYPKCPFHNQENPVRDIDGNVLYGRNCSHNFCPTGTKCVDGEFQAHCCDDIPDRGRECAPKEKGNSGIKYYYHRYRDRVYPYYYKGCGVPSNKLFYRPEDAAQITADYYLCPGFGHSGNCNFTIPRPEQTGLISPRCDEGEYCIKGPLPMRGLCCSHAVTARYDENQKAAKCEFYERVLKDPKTNQVVFGRSCADDFCPDGARCQEEEFESYCCESLVDINE